MRRIARSRGQSVSGTTASSVSGSWVASEGFVRSLRARRETRLMPKVR